MWPPGLKPPEQPHNRPLREMSEARVRLRPGGSRWSDRSDVLADPHGGRRGLRVRPWEGDSLAGVDLTAASEGCLRKIRRFLGPSLPVAAARDGLGEDRPHPLPSPALPTRSDRPWPDRRRPHPTAKIAPAKIAAAKIAAAKIAAASGGITGRCAPADARPACPRVARLRGGRAAGAVPRPSPPASRSR